MSQDLNNAEYYVETMKAMWKKGDKLGAFEPLKQANKIDPNPPEAVYLPPFLMMEFHDFKPLITFPSR